MEGYIHEYYTLPMVYQYRPLEWLYATLFFLHFWVSFVCSHQIDNLASQLILLLSTQDLTFLELFIIYFLLYGKEIRVFLFLVCRSLYVVWLTDPWRPMMAKGFKLWNSNILVGKLNLFKLCIVEFMREEDTKSRTELSAYWETWISRYYLFKFRICQMSWLGLLHFENCHQ